MPSPSTILAVLIGTYALVTTVFLISENRRPQATLAWMLAFYLAPGFGLLLYFFFGRDRRVFSKEKRLLRQDPELGAGPGIAPVLARQEGEIAQMAEDGTARRRLMMLARRNSGSTLVRAHHVEILQDARTFYPRLIADMQAARRSIHHQYFIWGADPVTEEFKRVMIEKARQGVEVRLLYDPVGSFLHLNRRYLAELRAGGVHVAPTSPLHWIHTLNFRNHRKISVIDGIIGYTGGMNMAEEHVDGGHGFEFWRDTQLRIVGDGAAILQSVFMVDWHNAVGEDLSAERCLPPDIDAALPPNDDPGVPIQIVTSGPDSQWAAIRQLYAYMVGSAQRRVYIQSPFFIPDATLAEALKLAALAGVDVRVMISARASGNPLPDWASNTYYPDMVAAGVQVHLYEKGYLHAKTIAIDSEICSIGSANIDIRSFSIHYELNAVLYDAALTRRLEAGFEADLADCRPFDPAEYRGRSRLLRFRDSATRLMSPLL